MRLVAHAFSSAPVNPPAALVKPKLRTTFQSIIAAESPEAYRRADGVWNGDGGNGKLGARRDSNGRRQQAADAEAGDGRDRAAKGSGEEDE